ncbi:TPA: VENN motif pre-toxin domain-containing protein [Yersinia enterocolitica]|nr:VENN motif pre-toxin domain-containing protein [Yersinia enterocolitica]
MLSRYQSTIVPVWPVACYRSAFPLTLASHPEQSAVVASGTRCPVYALSVAAVQCERDPQLFSRTQSHTETQLKAGNTISITSGRDTSLKGAQVSGETVKVDAGRNLTLQSEQDRNNYDSKQSSVSASGSFTFGTMTGSGSVSASKSKIDSDYTSVQEQTGFFAGKGGFDITVGEHTQLNGAVIGSTATADKNTLDTGSLGFSDLDNQASFNTSTSSMGLSSGGFTGSKDFISNMGGGIPITGGNSGDASSTTHAAVSDGTITIRNTDKQQQNVTDLSRDAEHANNALSPIFDKEKEQNRLREINLIGEIGNQVGDIARTQGKIAEEKALKDPQAIQAAKEALAAKGNLTPTEKQLTEQIRNTAMATYGTGSDLQRAIQAETAVTQGLTGGNLGQALAGGSAPYLAHEISKYLPADQNQTANLMAHAVLGAVVGHFNGNATVGAVSAFTAEAAAPAIINAMGWDKDHLTEQQKQTVSALGTLAAGLAGGLVGDSTADAVAGAQAGKNALENNYLNVSEKSELNIQKQKLQNSKDPAEREQAQQKINELIELDISRDKKVIEACGNGAAGSAACASARLDVIVAKGEYETGQYNNKVSQMYPDAYGHIVNLLNITSVDAQSQQQVKDAMVNYAMVQLGVDKTTAEAYVETYEGMKILSASLTPVIGVPAAKQLSKIVDANLKVVAKGNVDGNKFSDTNQGVRPSQLADFNKPTLINDVVQAKIDKRPDKNYPNGNMGTAHAEVGVIQQAFDKGMTQGREMAMSVAGKEVCNYCLSDVRAMAEKAGLKSLTIYEEATGNVLFWQQGMNKIENRGPAK